MKYINFESLQERGKVIRDDFQSRKPFRYTMFENFFRPEVSGLLYEGYPSVQDGMWDSTTYVDQKNKFQKNNFEKGSLFNGVFQELNSPDFLSWLESVTGINDLIGDDELFGGGLHQSINGAFLNVHVDYNLHPTTKYHRRLNVLVYMNKDWQEEYEGHLELWDLSDHKKVQLASYSPLFNRCVIFETNEISFHGHPKPLKTPPGVNRKSLATYYYTTRRPENEINAEHNTIYVNTEGLTGQLNRLAAGLKAFVERITKK